MYPDQAFYLLLLTIAWAYCGAKSIQAVGNAVLDSDKSDTPWCLTGMVWFGFCLVVPFAVMVVGFIRKVIG